MMIGQITCLICVSIACIYCLFVIHDKYKPNKKGGKPSIETPRYDELYLRQYRQGIYNICDCVQDNGEFGVYSSEYIVWQTEYKSDNIKDIAIFITLTRSIYRPNEYNLVLQTGIPLGHLESLYTRTTYRVIVLKKYKKEIEPMGKKKLNLDDKDMLISIRQYIYHFIDYSEVGCNRQSYTDKIYEEEYQMDFQDLKSKKFANIIFNIRARFYDRDKYCIVIQLSKSFYDMYQKDDYITIKLIVVDQKYNQAVKALKEVLGETKTMDEKQKILNDIEEAQRKLDEARKKLDEYNTEYKRWKPKENEAYFYVISNGMVGRDRWNSGFITDKKRCDFYNCFKTEGEALQEAEKILVRRQLEDIAKRLNKGEKIDWYDDEQPKYCIGLCCNDIITNFYYSHKTQGTVYCLDKNFLDVAKREIGEAGLIKYIRGEG